MKFAEKDRFPETMYPTQTDTQEESGMQTSRLLELTTMEQLEEQRYALDASDQAKLNVPSNLDLTPAGRRCFFMI